MSDELSKIGIYFDDLHTLRVLEPSIANDTNDLKDEASNFSQKLGDFKDISEDFVVMASKYAELVNKQKMKAIGAQNLLKTFSKERESERQKLQTHIAEKTVELERLKTEHQYLQRIEMEQQEIINHYYQAQ